MGNGPPSKKARTKKDVQPFLGDVSEPLKRNILSFLNGKTFCILLSVDRQFKQLLMGTSLPILRLWSDALTRMEESWQNRPDSPAEVMLRFMRATTPVSPENASVIIGPLNETRRSQFFRANLFVSGGQNAGSMFVRMYAWGLFNLR
jgi:hypothetical protein